MIRIRGLSKTYRSGKIETSVLREIDLDVEAGEFVSITGASGSGKTTLLHAIGGLDREFTGSIEVDGKQLKSLRDVDLSTYRNRSIGFVFQSFYLLPHLTCAQNVSLPALFTRDRVDADTIRIRSAEVLEQVGLADKSDARPSTLSGGQRQRVAIARALFNRPKLLLCDEPTGNLDQEMAMSIISLFEDLNASTGLTLLLVTHDAAIASRASRRTRVHGGLVHEVEPRPEASA